MISEFVSGVKSLIKANKHDLYIAAVIFFASLASFGLGRLSVIWPQKEQITISEALPKEKTAVSASSTDLLPANEEKTGENRQKTGKYVASKNGSAYHYPWCPGAMKIKKENEVWFQTKEEAERVGYKPAGNCEGL